MHDLAAILVVLILFAAAFGLLRLIASLVSAADASERRP
jgi:hypothetical protein